MANAYGVRCSVLTKGLLPESLAELPLRNEFGITAVSLNEQFIQEYEPGAAPIHARIQSLKTLHDQGCRTWVSIEPYPTPNMVEQNLAELLEMISFTDKIIFGRLHYNKIVSKYNGYQEFYNRCVEQVIDFCKQRGIDYHIKAGTLKDQDAQ